MDYAPFIYPPCYITSLGHSEAHPVHSIVCSHSHTNTRVHCNHTFWTIIWTQDTHSTIVSTRNFCRFVEYINNTWSLSKKSNSCHLFIYTRSYYTYIIIILYIYNHIIHISFILYIYNHQLATHHRSISPCLLHINPNVLWSGWVSAPHVWKSKILDSNPGHAKLTASNPHIFQNWICNINSFRKS